MGSRFTCKYMHTKDQRVDMHPVNSSDRTDDFLKIVLYNERIQSTLEEILSFQ